MLPACRRVSQEDLHRVPRALLHSRVLGFLLYKELGRRLKKTNPVVAEVTHHRRSCTLCVAICPNPPVSSGRLSLHSASTGNSVSCCQCCLMEGALTHRCKCQVFCASFYGLHKTHMHWSVHRAGHSNIRFPKTQPALCLRTGHKAALPCNYSARQTVLRHLTSTVNTLTVHEVL